MGKYACVKSAHQYAIEVAPPEVRPALEWLNASGYVVRSENGGPAEGDEGFLVEWERPPIVVRVVRQDAQWLMDIAPDGTNFESLSTVLNAEDGGDDVLDELELSDPVAGVLPTGADWSDRVPQVLSWLQEADRSRELAEADRRVKDASNVYWRHKKAEWRAEARTKLTERFFRR